MTPRADERSASPVGNGLRLKHRAEIQTGITLSGDGDADDPLWPYLRVANVQTGFVDLSEVKYIRVPAASANAATLRRGDVLMTEGGDIDKLGRGALWDASVAPMLHQNHVFAVRAGAHLSAEFLVYWLEARVARDYFLMTAKRSTNLASTNKRTVSNLPIPSVTLDEQQAITDYLDRETARIDTLIEEQQRLVETLQERMRAATTATFGVRVGQGERLKWHFVEVDERAGIAAATLPLMSVSISWGVRRRDEVTADEARADDLSGYKLCRKGELVINRMRAFQGALGIAPEDGIVSPDYAVLRPDHALDAIWLAAVMKSHAFVSEMASRIKGIGSVDLGSARTPRINISDLAEIRVEIPEAQVQSKELGQLTAQTFKIDTLIAETERFIELSRERRSALITAAVTGQIDVRGEVA